MPDKLDAALAETRAALLPVTSAAGLPGAHAGQAALRLLAAVDEVIRLLAGLPVRGKVGERIQAAIEKEEGK